MRCNLILFAAALFLCSSVAARGKPASEAQGSSQTGDPTSANPASDCSVPLDSSRMENQSSGRDQRPSQSPSDAVGDSEAADAAPAVVHLEQDLKTLDQRLTGLAQCILSTDAQGQTQDSQGACLGE